LKESPQTKKYKEKVFSPVLLERSLVKQKSKLEKRNKTKRRKN